MEEKKELTEEHTQEKDIKDENCVKKLCEEQFQWRMFSLTNQDPHVMIISHWPCLGPVPFFIYRLFMAVVATVLTILNGWFEYRRHNEPVIWFTWASNWGILAMNLVLWVLALYTFVYIIDKAKLISDDRMPFCLASAWALYNAMAASAFVISGSYWVFLFGMDASPIFHIPESYTKHSVNSLFMVVDLFISSIPIRLLHCYLPIGFAILYSIFSYLWYVFDGPLIKNQTAIYGVLNWREPGKAISFISLNIVLLVVAQAALWLIYRFRLYIQKRCCSVDEYEEIKSS